MWQGETWKDKLAPTQEDSAMHYPPLFSSFFRALFCPLKESITGQSAGYGEEQFRVEGVTGPGTVQSSARQDGKRQCSGQGKQISRQCRMQEERTGLGGEHDKKENKARHGRIEGRAW